MKQISWETDWDGWEWCKKHRKKFPNLSVMSDHKKGGHPSLVFWMPKKCFFVMGNDSRNIDSFCLKIACLCGAVDVSDAEIKKMGS